MTADLSVYELIFTVLTSGSILTFLGIIVNNYFQKRKVAAEVRHLGADSASVVSATAISLLEPMRKQLKEMQDSLDETRGELKQAQKQAIELRNEVRKLLNELSNYRELTQGELKVVDSV